MSKIGVGKYMKVFSKTNFRCAYCGEELDLDIKRPEIKYMDGVEYYNGGCQVNYAIDHVIPKKKGGTNDISNLLPCCKSCNSQKGSKDLESFRTSLTFKKYNIPKFSKEQLHYLASKINLKDIFPPRVKFYYETLKSIEGE